MSLYVCDKCGCVENTALASRYRGYGDQPLVRIYECSQCQTGIWHGKFPKAEWDGKREVINRKRVEE